MLSFVVNTNGNPPSQIDLSGAYLIGSDDVPLRAEVTYKKGIITCKKRSAGPAGLVVLWPVEGIGEVMVETVRLMERERPYILQVELARGRLMHISQKVEEWGLIDYDGTEHLVEIINDARRTLVRALQAETATEAADMGNESLALAVRAGEALSQYHAEVFLERRKQLGGFRRQVLGCRIDLDNSIDLAHKHLTEVADFVTVPITWRDIEPSEQTFNWKPLDTWVEALTKQRMPIKGSALLSFKEANVPDWLYIWEHDFDAIRDLAFEHIRRVINRYGQYIQVWDVISGIHATNCFTFSFEQLIELTRMAAALTKQIAPKSLAILEVIAPWGEYYARNQRTIPPQLYADMAVQSGVNFDAFGLQFHFGAPTDGNYVRDMFQVSSLIDAFAKPGKAIHITGIQVPSHSASGGETHGGFWHNPWSEDVQADWLERFLEVALSKPFVETVSWHGLTDHDSHAIPYGGLLNSGMAPKAALRRYQEIRHELHAAGGAKTG
ncbi:MAG: endo-1,4-beta-xylanase [Planctomycetota bacterium]|jgi:GH35 family endo-1,4-beta-xylanase